MQNITEDQFREQRFEEYRRRAEELIEKQEEIKDRERNALKHDISGLIHELHVHEIELRIQNEELRRTQKDLWESRDKYADLFEMAPVAYFMLDTKGRIIQVNTAGVELFGVEKIYLLHTLFVQYVVRSHKNDFRNHLQRAFFSGEKQSCETRLDNGKRNLFVQLESVYVRNNDDVEPFCRTAVLDITHRKMAEQLLRESHGRLEESLKRRTRELQEVNNSLHKQLEQNILGQCDLKATLNTLTATNSELKQFAYVASHDLQEPLRNIIVTLQMLEDRHKEALPAQATRLMDLARESAHHMANLIEDLLLYSREGSRAGEFESVDCNGLLRRILRDFSVTIRELDAEIVIAPLPTISADKLHLRQIFQNLISNSLKFHSDAPPRIYISARENAEEWVFSVEDNGIGIDPKFYERIFLMFQRLHTRREYSGTGVGLAIVKKIVESNGGRIWVDSTGRNKGTKISFSLPHKRPE